MFHVMKNDSLDYLKNLFSVDERSDRVDNYDLFKNTPIDFYEVCDTSPMQNHRVNNHKQEECIIKRIKRREFLNKFMKKSSNKYVHESRHKHAMNRMRAPSGRFLTKKESDEIKRKMH